MARQSGAKTYFIARKGMKVYLTDPIHVTVHSITTQHEQDLYLSGEDAARIRGKRILIVDDVISTGDSLKAMEELVVDAPAAPLPGRMAVLAEGDAQESRRHHLSQSPASFQRRRHRQRMIPCISKAPHFTSP